MEAMEVVAVVIIIIAIAVLIYYYFLNNPQSVNKLKDYVPSSADAHMDELLGKTQEKIKINVEDEESDSVGKKIKSMIGDVDMSSINTDMFSKKLDSFFDEKSEELIKDWSLATLDDLDALESKFLETSNSIDGLTKDYNEFKKSSLEFQEDTRGKLDDLDKRINDLENK